MNLAAGISFDPRNTLLTPHPGEWKRLRKSMQELRGIEDLEAARQEFPTCSVIYKSSTPIVLSPDRASFLTLGDNSLAKAGSGDRLAGTVLGLSSTPRALGELAALAQNLLATEAREKTQD